ncbi:hypothetical protein [Bacillus toyonensis]|uniref:hypothetical protein n=1 Tax=Bacillus toyonensis TaxID=155322 RepID=UPI000BFD05FB|nr:hypothetical protein [Bacillus toyonensis]PHC50198.1 hypothetical protein COF08_18060 [Bacillus toyonensis]
MENTTKLNDTIQEIAEHEVEQYARYIKKVKEINEMKTMEEILSDLEKSFIGDCPFEELPHVRQAMIYNKFQLRDEIEDGFITDVEKAKKWLELIELVYEWAHDDEYEMEHRLIFSEGVVEIDSISEYCGGDWTLDYKDGALYLDDENFGDSILHLLNYIESGL